MHKAFVALFEIAARDPDVLRRFYALLFGWRLSADGVEAHNFSVMTADCNRTGGVISSAGDVRSGGVKLIVEVDDVLENLYYAEELGGKIIDPPHEITSAGGRVTVASFADPEGNCVKLSSGSSTALPRAC